MVSFTLRSLTALSIASIAAATPCPYGNLAEKGQLTAEDSAKFYAARSEGNAAVEEMMSDVKKREFVEQEQYYKRQLDLGELLLGGGLLNGVLQPFTGILEALDVPVPQEFSLKLIPGNDPNHQYKAPGKTDVRGMCPTLNTMANHGYINRNGITNFAQAANACQITLAFGYDTCVFLSALGLLAGGDLATGAYSIGGADARVPNTLGPALGISKHGSFEIDNSISRQDTYFGNQADFQLTRWNRMLSLANKYGGEFGNDMWAEERVITYKESKDTNPEFNAEVKWLAVSTAERVFIFRAMPNGTFPGLADYQNVAPFYLNETFPKNWFRRAQPYSLVETGTDIVNLLATSSELTTPGHNEGLNNFVPLGLDIATFTPTQATCLLATSILDLVPGQIAPVIAENFDTVQAFLNGAVKPFFAPFKCESDQYAAPGPSAGNPTAGVSARCNVLVNGKYTC